MTFEDFRIEHIDRLMWLWPCAAIAIAALAALIWRHRRLRQLADARLLAGVMPGFRSWRGWTRLVLGLVAIAALIPALIDVRWGYEERTVRRHGIDVVVLLDLSQSMMAEDASPTRLDRARQYIHDMVNAMDGDRVALVTFAGRAKLQCPLTVDHSAFRLSLDTVDTAEISLGGSRLGDAIRFCGEVFTDEEPQFKAIVVFTDGEDHESEPLFAANELYEKLDVPIYTVGIGDDDDGAKVPVPSGSRGRFVQYEGADVVSRLDGALLREIADSTGGAYVPVGTGVVDMSAIYEQRIEPAEKQAAESRDVRQYMPRYQYFLVGTLVLLLFESCLGAHAPIRRRS